MSKVRKKKDKRKGVRSVGGFRDSKKFLAQSDPYRQLHYSLFNGEVGNILSILPKRHYTLLTANIPYGFRIMGSMYNDVPYKYPHVEKMVKAFVELSLAPLWRIVIFHSMGQSLSVTTTLKSCFHVIEHMHW